MNPTLFVLSVTILLSCKTQKLSLQNSGDMILQMSKSPCFGYCPVYDLAIYKNGMMKLKSKQNLKQEGSYTKMLTKTELKTLQSNIKALDYSNLQNEYNEQIADAPSTTVTFYDADQTKTISTNYHYPDKLQKFTEELHQKVLDADWIKSVDNRQKTEIIVQLHDGKNLSALLKTYADNELMLGKRLDPATNQYWMLTAMLAPNEVEHFITQLRKDPVIKEAQLNKKLETR